MKINKIEPRILLMAGVTMAVILSFWFFIYRPKNKEMKRLRSEYLEVEKDIDNIERMTGDSENLNVVLAKYNEKLKEYENMLPYKEETTLRELATQADRLGIKVVSISPEAPSDSKLPIVIEGSRCKELKINIELVTSYKKLGEYIGILQDNFPTLLRIDSVNIRKLDERGAESVLSVSLDVALFMLVKQ